MGQSQPARSRLLGPVRPLLATATPRVRAEAYRPLRGGILEPLAAELDVDPLVKEANEVAELEVIGKGSG
jgi:hypothetical protein